MSTDPDFGLSGTTDAYAPFLFSLNIASILRPKINCIVAGKENL
jgi:hypothetical protein